MPGKADEVALSYLAKLFFLTELLSAYYYQRGLPVDYQVLARKWRPKNFTEIVGQQPTLKILQHALTAKQMPHACLFTGTRGVGKTTIARIVAKCLNCELGVSAKPCGTCSACLAIDVGRHIDVLEIDAASKTRVEDTRELLDNVPYAPTQGQFKVYIIDEVHMLSNHSFNALLKTLEEPPPHVKFLLATTDPQKLPITILSRCLQFHLTKFNIQEIVTHLTHVLQTEQIKFEILAIKRIAFAAEGSMRDALTLLEQVIALGNGIVTEQAVLEILGIATSDLLIELMQAIVNARINKQIEPLFVVIAKLDKAGVDFSKMLKELQILLHQIILLQLSANCLTNDWLRADELISLAKQISTQEIQQCYQLATNGQRDLPYMPDERLGFEMIILRMITFKHNAPKEVPAPEIVVNQEVKPEPQVKAQNPDWQTLIEQFDLKGVIKIIAKNCLVVYWQTEKISLMIKPEFASMLQQFPDAKTIIEQAVQKHFNHKFELSIEVPTANKFNKNSHAVNNERQSTNAKLQAVKAHPYVKKMITTFDAKVEDVVELNE